MIYIGADHAGFKLKQKIIAHLREQKKEVVDCGATTFDGADDYPDFAAALAQKITDPSDWGILLCASGQGVCVATNKFKGIRAAQAWSVESARAARHDDNINVLCLAGKIKNLDEPLAIVDAFLATDFEAVERRLRRLQKVSALEK